MARRCARRGRDQSRQRSADWTAQQLSGEAELAQAADAAARGFSAWRKVSAFERSKPALQVQILRDRAEQDDRRDHDHGAVCGSPCGGRGSKPWLAAADIIDWFAEEAQRARSGRVISGRSGRRSAGIGRARGGRARGLEVLHALELPDQSGGPQGMPSAMAARLFTLKLKGLEETPASCAALVQAYARRWHTRGDALNLAGLRRCPRTGHDAT